MFDRVDVINFATNAINLRVTKAKLFVYPANLSHFLFQKSFSVHICGECFIS